MSESSPCQSGFEAKLTEWVERGMGRDRTSPWRGGSVRAGWSILSRGSLAGGGSVRGVVGSVTTTCGDSGGQGQAVEEEKTPSQKIQMQKVMQDAEQECLDQCVT